MSSKLNNMQEATIDQHLKGVNKENCPKGLAKLAAWGTASLGRPPSWLLTRVSYSLNVSEPLERSARKASRQAVQFIQAFPISSQAAFFHSINPNVFGFSLLL